MSAETMRAAKLEPLKVGLGQRLQTGVWNAGVPRRELG
jgi:hypothetical protein